MGWLHLVDSNSGLLVTVAVFVVMAFAMMVMFVPAARFVPFFFIILGKRLLALFNVVCVAAHG
jgi:hypothetical protein